MKVKWVVPAVAGALLFVSLNPVLFAVNTRMIKEVRNKDLLSSEDLRAIDRFVADAVKELVRTKDFSSVAAVRNAISEHASSNRPSAPQYEAQYFESANRYISEALNKAREDKNLMVEINLLILIDRLLATDPEDLRLVDLALEMVQDDSGVVRYLAVSAVTNPAVLKRMNPKLAARIASTFSSVAAGSTPETMGLMARFAGETDTAQSGDLLLRIADRRIKRYAEWAVKYEPLDDAILKSLCNKISSPGPEKSSFAQRFVQLYSYAIQRFAKDMQVGVFVSDASRELAASVLLEVEKTCISRLTAGPHTAIKSSIERGDREGLLRAHDVLLRQELPRMFEGVKPPLPLPDPPKPKASEQ